MSKKTFFKSQFPTESVVEISPASLSDSKKFINYDLNIGWALTTINSYYPNKNKKDDKLRGGDDIDDHRINKKCLGALQCFNNSCRLVGTYIRPPVDLKKIEQNECLVCKAALSYTPCEVRVKFHFSVKQLNCTMEHIINKEKGIFHNHGNYVQKHLTHEELGKVDAMIKKNPSITPSAAVTGIADSRIFSPDENIENINRILLNSGRAKHELRASRIRNGLIKNSNIDPIEEWDKIEKEYPNFLVSAEFVDSRFCIFFSAPEMKLNKLPFDTQPMITDVTYSAVPKGYYLCSTVIYVPVMKRHVVIFQAIIKHTTAEQFKIYFFALFTTFNIEEPEEFFGMIMDFSRAQRNGFIQALRVCFGLNEAQAMPFLKGCYMHWKQSVQKVVSNYSAVPSDKSRRFLSLVHEMQTTTDEFVFIQSAQSILREFPNTRPWLRWWVQPSICSLIFNCRTVMKEELKQHESRTSNAIESYHSSLYRLIPKKKPVYTSLRLLLQVCKREDRLMKNIYVYAIPPSYGKKRKSRAVYKNDGRGPDSKKTMGISNKKKLVKKDVGKSDEDDDLDQVFEYEELLVKEKNENHPEIFDDNFKEDLEIFESVVDKGLLELFKGNLNHFLFK